MILKKIELTAKDKLFVKTVENKIYEDPKSGRQYIFHSFVADPLGGTTLKVLLREINCKDEDCLLKSYIIDRLALNQFIVKYIDKK